MNGTVPPRFARRFIVGNPNRSIAELTLRAPTARELKLESWAFPEGFVVLDDVWCDPQARGQGLVTGLMRAAQDVVRPHGWSISCRPFPHGEGRNLKSLTDFYRKLGFGRTLSTHPREVWISWPPDCRAG